MLNAGIQQSYAHGIGALGTASGVSKLASGGDADERLPRATGPLFCTTADQTSYGRTLRLAEEVFGPVALLIACTR